jgi:hypothetical protein
VLFLADPDDSAELEAIDRESIRGGLCVKVDTGGGRYSEKINRGVRLTTEPFVFTGADDLDFKPGWFQAANARLSDRIGCVGTQDRCNPRVIRGEHATHFLLARWYAEQPCIDGSPGPLFEGYSHWCVDDELIGTAQMRGAYAFAGDAVVEHLHPLADKAQDDETYRKGEANAHKDLRLRDSRRRLWR